MKFVAKEINLKIEKKIILDRFTMRAELGQDQKTTFNFR